MAQAAGELHPDQGLAPDRGAITFLMIGCQRCGSTWLYEALKEHPQIFLPESKQTHFFDESYQNGMDWYLEHFRGITQDHRAVGEVATSYCLPANIPLVARELPNIKIIMAMRNPVDRAFSYYRSRAPHENWKSFEDALKKTPQITARGQYMDQINILLQHYDRENILFLFYDDLRKDERAYVRSVYTFLGVDPDFEPKVIGNPVRAAMFPRTRRILKRMGLTPLVNLVNKSLIGDILRRTLRKRRVERKASPQMPPDVRQELLEHFRPYNALLAKELGRDLSRWQE